MVIHSNTLTLLHNYTAKIARLPQFAELPLQYFLRFPMGFSTERLAAARGTLQFGQFGSPLRAEDIRFVSQHSSSMKSEITSTSHVSSGIIHRACGDPMGSVPVAGKFLVLLEAKRAPETAFARGALLICCWYLRLFHFKCPRCSFAEPTDQHRPFSRAERCLHRNGLTWRCGFGLGR